MEKGSSPYEEVLLHRVKHLFLKDSDQSSDETLQEVEKIPNSVETLVTDLGIASLALLQSSGLKSDLT